LLAKPAMFADPYPYRRQYKRAIMNTGPIANIDIASTANKLGTATDDTIVAYNDFRWLMENKLYVGSNNGTLSNDDGTRPNNVKISRHNFLY